jgi:hypothetical protein
MAGAFEPISTYTVTAAGGDTNISFTNIPQTYTNLHIRGRLRIDGNYGWYGCGLTINNDIASSGNKYSWQRIYCSNGTSADFQSYTNPDRFYWPYAPAANSGNSLSFAAFTVDIHDYTNANKKKAVKSFSGFGDSSARTSSLIMYVNGQYIGTSAVTRLDFTTIGGMTKILQYSTFALYGIKNS